jgi:8-oxo-dGTP pyrophosphatase MutT (NUDIX family)
MAAMRRRNCGGRKAPAGAWQVTEAVWGDVQRVRLTTGPPSLVTGPERVRSVHAVGFVGDSTPLPAQVLLVQNKDGTWTFPGGRLEGKETSDEALARELWEEARAALAPGYVPVAATQIEFLNRVPGRVYRFHPSFLVWVAGSVDALSDEPHHDPADYVTERRVMRIEEARDRLAPLECVVLEAAVAKWRANGR